MIHVATVHWNTDRWVSLQQEYLRRYLKDEFRIYAWLNDVPNAPLDSFYYSCTEPVVSHAVKLNLLTEIIRASATSPDDRLIFLDGDAFPIAEIEPLMDQELPARKLIAVQRLENNGDIQPHPCFCATTVGFWKEIRGDWKEGHWENRDGNKVSDVGGILLKQLADRGVNWTPLLRTNKVNLHPLFFGIYGGVIYHHGAGFRKGECRLDAKTLELTTAGRFFSKVVPGYRRKVMRKTWQELVAANDQLSERVFREIQDGPGFKSRFA